MDPSQVAGPSHIQPDPSLLDAPLRTVAPEKPLPHNNLFSVEYPGYVSQESIPKALKSLGGLNTAFKRAPNSHSSNKDVLSLVELSLRPGDPFAHPIPGDVVPTSNLVLKVIKRKYKRKDSAVEEPERIGSYTTEVVGLIPKTVRFRGMVDYQFLPDMDDPISKLRLAMDSMDVDAIRAYTMPEEKEDYTVPRPDSSAMEDEKDKDVLGEDNGMDVDPPAEGAMGPPPLPAPAAVPNLIRSNLRLFPPPLFSRQIIPQNYNFKPNPASMLSLTVNEETGEEKKRLVNKMRWKGHGPASITFADATVPDKPPASAEAVRKQVDQRVLKRMLELMQERPVWTRMSLFNQFSAAESREIHNSKNIIPLGAYIFQDGPWRDTLVRFGYDPRKQIEARFYQRLYFRNANHPMARPSVSSRRADRYVANMQVRAEEAVRTSEDDRRQSHIFDGFRLAKETAAFQLCDITDPMLKGMIKEEDDLRDTPHERDGWYSSHGFERIKTVLRHKFFSLLEGYIATDEECENMLDTGRVAVTMRIEKRSGKHNMAKGALRPEDAAAKRLRATLDRNAKMRKDQKLTGVSVPAK